MYHLHWTVLWNTWPLHRQTFTASSKERRQSSIETEISHWRCSHSPGLWADAASHKLWNFLGQHPTWSPTHITPWDRQVSGAHTSPPPRWASLSNRLVVKGLHWKEALMSRRNPPYWSISPLPLCHPQRREGTAGHRPLYNNPSLPWRWLLGRLLSSRLNNHRSFNLPS